MATTTFSGPVVSLNGFQTGSPPIDTFIGDVVGNVTGNVAGDVIGNVTGNVAGDVTGNVTGNSTGITFGTVTTRSGAGAVAITASSVRLTTTGADALTLANGANGQLITIVMVVDGGDGVLTPSTKTGFSTVTFSAVGQSVTLQYFTTLGWMVVSNVGAALA